MNHPARLFALLSTAFAFEPASELVERLAAEFAAAVALDVYLHRTPLLLTVIGPEQNVSEGMENLRLYLRCYGLILVARPLKGSKLLVGVRLARPSDEVTEHTGTVRERQRVVAS